MQPMLEHLLELLLECLVQPPMQPPLKKILEIRVVSEGGMGRRGRHGTAAEQGEEVHELNTNELSAQP